MVTHDLSVHHSSIEGFISLNKNQSTFKEILLEFFLLLNEYLYRKCMFDFTICIKFKRVHTNYVGISLIFLRLKSKRYSEKVLPKNSELIVEEFSNVRQKLKILLQLLARIEVTLHMGATRTAPSQNEGSFLCKSRVTAPPMDSPYKNLAFPLYSCSSEI